MTRTYETITVHLQKGIATVRMNRPGSMNAFERQLRIDLLEGLRELDANRDVKVIVLTGTDTAFSAGGDLRELKEGMNLAQAEAYMDEVSQAIPVLCRLTKPTIAAVNGVAFGAGWSIAMACDLIIASEEATFSLAFVKVGLVPDLAATYFLPRLVGLQKAKELVFTGRAMGARELETHGLINRVVPAHELNAHVMELAAEIAAGAPLALSRAKKLLNRSLDLSLDEVLSLENKTQATCLVSKDHREGVTAFFEKRKAQFTGS